ncbi:MAG: ATP-binding cassette domain-containing protein [Planctomycetes bacterium]|nr:ATP-binding cassette domain-containing protein [Planctomycetota bacterium]
MTAPLVVARGLAKRFELPRAPFAPRRCVHALRGVDFELHAGERVALVGESGSGKTTLARLLARLYRPDVGTLVWRARDGRELDLARASEGGLRPMRRELGLVFQDPFASLDPRRTVRAIVGEALEAHGLARGAELECRVAAWIERVGLTFGALARRPHAFSGGERQRIALARALATEPRLLILDEAFSALDAPRALELVRLLEALHAELGFALVLVAHDLALARRLTERVVVLYAGRVVEEGPAEEVFVRPKHPYTQALVAAAPAWSATAPPRKGLAGDPPSAEAPPPGCAFHPRCPLAVDACRASVPALTAVGGIRLACPITASRSGA